MVKVFDKATGDAYENSDVIKVAVITGYIDVFELVRAEDLADPYTSGIHGLQCEGLEGYSEFSNVQKVVAD